MARGAGRGGRRLVVALGVDLAMVLGLTVLTGCSAAPADRTDPAARQPSLPPLRTVSPVGLGASQAVAAASSFGPGTVDVPVTITVYAFRDHVAPTGPPPATPGAHWASADVGVCRSKPVIFGYPAWVLGDDAGRTAQETKVGHPQFPQPAFPDSSTRAGCARGWVTWVTPDTLTATKVTFEQTREIPGPWRLR